MKKFLAGLISILTVGTCIYAIPTSADTTEEQTTTSYIMSTVPMPYEYIGKVVSINDDTIVIQYVFSNQNSNFINGEQSYSSANLNKNIEVGSYVNVSFWDYFWDSNKDMISNLEITLTDDNDIPVSLTGTVIDNTNYNVTVQFDNNITHTFPQYLITCNVGDTIKVTNQGDVIDDAWFNYANIEVIEPSETTSVTEVPTEVTTLETTSTDDISLGESDIEYPRGDVNQDGKTNSLDLLVLKKHLLGLIEW